jgi:uncharacterized membrane protein YgcG
MSTTKTDERLDSRSIPAIDSTEIVSSILNFRMYLLGQKQADQGLDPMTTEKPIQYAGQEWDEFSWLMDEWRAEEAIWENRRAVAMAALFRATSVEPSVTEVRNLYMADCKTNKKRPQAAELISILETRFVEKDESKLRIAQGKFDRLKVLPKEDLEKTMTRMDQIILELTDLGQPPTEATKVLRLTRALNNGDDHLKQLMYTMATNANGNATTFDKLKATLKTFQNYLNDEAEENSSDPEPKVKTVNNMEPSTTPKCDYCFILGHNMESCRKRISDRAWYAKNAKSKGSGKGKKGSGRGSGGKGASFSGRGGGKGKSGDAKWTPVEGYSGCHNCGSKDHRKADCTEEKPAKKVKWNGAKEVNMINSVGEINLAFEAEGDVIFLDSCCSSGMIIIMQTESMMKYARYRRQILNQRIQLSEAGKSMEISNDCTIGPFHNCYICPLANRNICGTSRLVDHGYGMTTDGSGTHVFDDATKTHVVKCGTLNGMPFMKMSEFVRLRHKTASSEDETVNMLAQPLVLMGQNREELLKESHVPCELPVITFDTPEEEWPMSDRIGMAGARITHCCNQLKREDLSCERRIRLEEDKNKLLQAMIDLTEEKM